MRGLPKAAITMAILLPEGFLIHTFKIIGVFQAPISFVLNLPCFLAFQAGTNNLIRPVFVRGELILAYFAAHRRNIAYNFSYVKNIHKGQVPSQSEKCPFLGTVLALE